MILFKACPRCGGDVDTTYRDDVYCVQCAYRPTVVFSGPVFAEGWRGKAASAAPPSVRRAKQESGHPMSLSLLNTKVRCPKCDSAKVVVLDRLRPQNNVCYRCLPCGHIFSPVAGERRGNPGAALP